MAQALEITLSRGGREIVELQGDNLRVDARGGASYRLIDTENPEARFEAIIRRVGDDLQIDVLGSDADIVLVDYFFICELDFRGCSIELDTIGGGSGETLTPDNLNATALSDGTALLWTTPPVASAATDAPATIAAVTTSASDTAGAGDELPWKMIGAVGGGVLAIGALAGGGSGGDSATGSDSSGSGTLASRSVSIDEAISNASTPVDGDGNPLTAPGVSVGPGPVASGGQTNDSSPQLTGTIDQALTSDQQILVFRDGVEIGQATTSGTDWSFTDSNVPAGEHTYAVRLVDSAGNRSPLSADYVLQVDGDAPGKPVLDPVTGDNQISAAEESEGVAVTGQAEAGSVVTGQWGATTQTSTADSSGRFVLQFSPSDLPDASVSPILVTAIDSFGNVSATTEQTVEFTSHHGITITAVIDDREALTGEFGSGATINDVRPTIIGTLNRPLEDGQSVQVFRNGVFIDTAQVDGSNWSFNDGNLSNGQYSHQVRIVDGSGNVLATSPAAFVFEVDVSAPSRPSIERVDTRNYRVDDESASDGVQVSGEAEAGTTVTVTWGGQERSTEVQSNGDWSLTFEQVPVDDGRSILRAMATDDAGNASRERLVIVRTDVSEQLQLAGTEVNDSNDSGAVATQSVITAADLLETGDSTAGLMSFDDAGDASAVASGYTVNADVTGAGNPLLDPLANPPSSSVI